MSKIPRILSLGAMALYCMHSVAVAAPLLPDHASPVVAGNPLVQKVHDCHADIRYGWVPGLDGRYEHKHRSNCRAILYDDGPDFSHCHRDGRKHSHSGVGRTVHSHHGRSCRVDVWERRRGSSGGGRGCIQVGPVTFCP